jgi:hypothetical protein
LVSNTAAISTAPAPFLSQFQSLRSDQPSLRIPPTTLIDLDAGIIMNVEANPVHRTLEVESTEAVVQRVKKHVVKDRVAILYLISVTNL